MAMTQQQWDALYSRLVEDLHGSGADDRDFAKLAGSLFVLPLLRNGMSGPEAREVGVELAKMWKEAMECESAITRSQLRRMNPIGVVQ